MAVYNETQDTRKRDKDKKQMSPREKWNGEGEKVRGEKDWGENTLDF